MKKSAKLILTLIVILAIAFFSASNYYNDNIKPVAIEDSSTVVLTVPTGTTPGGIGDILYDNGLVSDLTVYKVYLKLNGRGSLFKAGDYEMSRSMSLDEICSLLENGSNVNRTINITVREGLTIIEAAEEINEQLSIDKDRFLSLCDDVEYFSHEYEFLKSENIKSLEGYLYPETYNVYLDSDEETLIRRFLDGYQSIYDSYMADNIDDINDLNRIMTMASIVEGEALKDSERPAISSVFHNRIELGWKLESCATVQYALGERKPRLTYDDLEIDSVYNTYLYEGLPPGPINSPGLESIKAALNPEETDYLFFLAKGDGFHYFTDNYDDFLEAKRKYIN
ncbi:UPF0755 protein [Dethiosulfatibacter aminovorans DSM 17477]|uniref:Endolytic murein transglycosylase n=1 Tax=Dethiosulfatibacter aminovorans DSM 17477 TaxID=1121476 RepID=A0A1M6D6N9_9FIRM|nr:endolytic transglycosylase MltG [Dethiosulfatibacter aminovorans]SHI68860.1 UPF0755 protein [Dethiosulfatibacter aminovorans DSM 17477]